MTSTIVSHFFGNSVSGICLVEHVLQAAQCGNVKIITMLEKAGGQINVTNTSGMTPLAYSAGQGNVKALHILLNKGADLNFYNQDGTTPLHQAASSGNQVLFACQAFGGFEGSCLQLTHHTLQHTASCYWWFPSMSTYSLLISTAVVRSV